MLKVITKLVTFHVLILLTSSANAQHPKDDIKQNIRRSASNLMSYPGPQQHSLTPALPGTHPFYISHYGRHGSRYLLNKEDYEAPYHVLVEADKAGKLTAKGYDVMQRLKRIHKEAFDRWGELTPSGVRQQQMIAQRLTERFPEVFGDKATVDARSSTVTRCILSMEHFLLQLTSLKPHLTIHHEASRRDMTFLYHQDRQLMKDRMDSVTTAQYNKYCSRFNKYGHLMLLLFNDMTYVNQHVDARKLNDDLFRLASNMQNTELRHHITLYDIFSDKDLYNCWMKENAWWYINHGGYPLNGGKQPYSQRNLLRRLISDADSCIRQENPCAQLRFGHDEVILSLACLMDINHWALATSKLEVLGKKGWCNYHIAPMAANIQLVFYRSNPDDNDVWVKVLYNEDEATLPLPDSHAPYYRWSDFRTYYLEKLDEYEKY